VSAPDEPHKPDTNTGSGHTFDEACWDALSKRKVAGYPPKAEIERHTVHIAESAGVAQLWHVVKLRTVTP
jgi:hypothetical protein